MTQIIPLPKIDITTRIATMADLPFVDALQKAHHRELGFFPRAQMEGYLKNEWMIIAENAGIPVGYCASRDRYLKRDELGAIFQLCVAPGKQRGLIGASLLKDVFERASYGTRLFCCWCAQDLQANYFWEAMGFVPLAFRTGGRHKGTKARRHEGEEAALPPVPSCLNASVPSARIHIFWEKRIRQGDTTTSYWFPSQTGGGSIREDRLVLPIPPGLTWSDEMPILLPTARLSLPAEPKRIERKTLRKPTVYQSQFGLPSAKPIAKPTPAKKAKRPAIKIDPRHVAAARELRDRWLEKVNENPSLLSQGKYDVARLPVPNREPMKMLAA